MGKWKKEKDRLNRRRKWRVLSKNADVFYALEGRNRRTMARRPSLMYCKGRQCDYPHSSSLAANHRYIMFS